MQLAIRTAIPIAIGILFKEDSLVVGGAARCGAVQPGFAAEAAG